jgi:two-component system, sensor histidine kinase and response regulator
MNDDVRDCSHSIASAADNMLRMVHNLLDVSRAEDASLSLRLQHVDVSALVQKTCALMARRSEDKRVSLHAEIAREGLMLDADADLLRRVVENLIDNASRYSSANGRVTVRVFEDGKELALQIADQGPGVPPDQRERIFEKYAQLDRKVDRAQQRFGRGIGLAFVKLAVQAHKGRIWVEDNQPVGARFELRFPRDAGTSVIAIPPP